MKKSKLLIAGPCSVETKDQFFETATELKALCRPDYIRGGVWKPRTRPGSFEGLGEIALEWMTEWRALHKVPIAIEVATKEQVKLALEYDVDLLWIGARTTVNPFSVQEIANELAGTLKPVYVKNPLNSDISLWIGAVERLEKSNIKNIGLIHRGFNVVGNTLYRNPPMWHLALEMKNKFPDLNFICDPSHIGGRSELIYDISQNSLNLDYNGLMIESHRDPTNAWSDAQQQLTPIELKAVLDELDFEIYEKIDNRTNVLNNAGISQLSLIDNELVYLILKRKEIADQLLHERLQFKMNLQNQRIQDRLITSGIISNDFIEKLKFLLQ
jgi:chorismate mutase